MTALARYARNRVACGPCRSESPRGRRTISLSLFVGCFARQSIDSTRSADTRQHSAAALRASCKNGLQGKFLANSIAPSRKCLCVCVCAHVMDSIFLIGLSTLPVPSPLVCVCVWKTLCLAVASPISPKGTLARRRVIERVR